MLRFRLLLVVLAACSETTGLDRLVITATVSPDHIVPGDTAAIVVRITNPLPTAVEIPNRCAHPYQIANTQGEIVVGNESLICTLELRAPIVLQPFASIERRALWTGYRSRLEGSQWVTEPVAEGRYLLYGRFEGFLSAPATIDVEAAP
jgi:hypothetical protein